MRKYWRICSACGRRFKSYDPLDTLCDRCVVFLPKKRVIEAVREVAREAGLEHEVF